MNTKIKSIILLGFAISSITVLVITLRGSAMDKVLAGPVESLSYSNEGPGAQGFRKTQAVRCPDTLWGISVKPGCCGGSELCFDMNPCNGQRFSCDNNHWIDPEL